MTCAACLRVATLRLRLWFRKVEERIVTKEKRERESTCVCMCVCERESLKNKYKRLRREKAKEKQQRAGRSEERVYSDIAIS